MADPDVWIGPDHLRFGRVRESDPLLKKELLTLEKDSVHQTIGNTSSSYPMCYCLSMQIWALE